MAALGLVRRYPTPQADELTVLDGLDLEVAAGERVAILGRSGVGKSTLLGILGGLEPPTGGTVLVGDVDVGALRGDDLAAYRSSTVGFVFQHFGLLDSLSARENVEVAMSVGGMRPAARRARADDLLARVGLADRGHRPGTLSGGERQRVAIARAVANAPRLVLADEPSGNLDAESTELVLDLLDALADDQGFTFIVATHDPAVTARVARHAPAGWRVERRMTFRDVAAMALHSARRRLGRVVLTVSAVALAAALLTALLIAVGAARNRVLTAVSDGGPLSGVQVFPNTADAGQLDTDSARLGAAREIDAAAIRRIGALPGVKSVVSLVSTPAVVVPPPDPADGRTHAFRDAVTGADIAQAARLPLTLVAGRLPGAASLHEVVVTEAYLRLVHLEDRTAARALGTEIEIGAPRVSAVPGGSSVDLRWSRAVVVGVVSVQGIDGHVVTSRAAVDELRKWSATSVVPEGNGDLAQFARDLTGASPNSLLFVVADGLGAVGDVRAGVTRIGFSSSAPESLITSVDRYTTVVKIVLTAIGLIALGVAGLGIANAMLAAVRERRTDIGVLKAIGARDRDVRRLFLVEAAGLGVVGGIAGTALGYGIARLVGLAVNDYLTSQRLTGVQIGLPLSVLALGVGGSCLLAVIAGTVPAQRAAQIPARQAMSS